MPEMIITFAEKGKPDYVVTVPAATVEAADAYALRSEKAGTAHLIMRYLLDNLLIGAVLSQTPLPQEIQDKIKIMQDELNQKKIDIEIERLAEYLPLLSIDGKEITLPQIEKQLAQAKLNK